MPKKVKRTHRRMSSKTNKNAANTPSRVIYDPQERLRHDLSSPDLAWPAVVGPVPDIEIERRSILSEKIGRKSSSKLKNILKRTDFAWTMVCEPIADHETTRRRQMIIELRKEFRLDVI